MSTDRPPLEDLDWPVVDGEPPSPRRDRRRPLLLTVAIAAAIVVIVAGGGLLWADNQINPSGRRGPDVTVVIPPGASTSRIGSLLAAAGVVHDGTLFAWYVRLRGDGPLYPGTYRLPRNSPYSAAVKALETGPVVPTAKLVIPEGYTVADIARAVGALPGIGISAQAFLAAASSGAVRSPYEPPGVNNLEGLLFPATYQVRQGEPVDDLLEEMIGAFDQRAQELGLDAAAARLGYTPYQVITVASIVEREAKLAADRGPVASAIYNRLKAGMPLGADSTQTYYLRLNDPTLQPTPAELDQPSPYNTRTNKGLPPTPISNPGLASLQAAADPPSTDYLYFVEINPDGKLGFASTASGFYSLKQQCRAANLC
ncbi:MAG TPA: endolytic transglycosylase MltG [Acidimicrobiales bacterium]|nr:endolytic transglycosylase MltG [Acidimicrobiales bacterium]